MGWFYYITGKIFSWAFFIIVIGSVGYYFGYHRVKVPILKDYISVKIPDLPNFAQQLKKKKEIAMKSTTSPVSDNVKGAKSKKIVTGGINKFTKYTVEIPHDWEVVKTQDSEAGREKLLISKDSYTLTIEQRTGESAICIYPGDNDSSERFDRYNSFIEIQGKKNLVFRRSAFTVPPKAFDICQKQKDSYLFPTAFGYISYSIPTKSKNNMIELMDEMISTLAKK